MEPNRDASETAPRLTSLSTRLQGLRMRKGWNMDRLSEAAGVSRTTLYHLERGDIAKPRASTLYKLAVALGVAPQELSPEAIPNVDGDPDGPANRPAEQAPPWAKFDRHTNSCVQAAYHAGTAHFAGWSPQEWDELYSTFGVGGQMSEQGVLDIARKINRKRETIQQLQVVLETHHAEIAAGLIANLYRLVQAELDAAMPSLPPVAGATTLPTESGER